MEMILVNILEMFSKLPCGKSTVPGEFNIFSISPLN